jgi:hypothetical protein
LADAGTFVLALTVKSNSANILTLGLASSQFVARIGGGGGVELIVATAFSAPPGTNDVSTGLDGTASGVFLVVATTGTAPAGAEPTSLVGGMLRTALESTLPVLPTLTLLGTHGGSDQINIAQTIQAYATYEAAYNVVEMLLHRPSTSTPHETAPPYCETS